MKLRCDSVCCDNYLFPHMHEQSVFPIYQHKMKALLVQIQLVPLQTSGLTDPVTPGLSQGIDLLILAVGVYRALN